MEERIMTNETYDYSGKLIYREIIKITTYNDGQVIEEVLSIEEF